MWHEANPSPFFPPNTHTCCHHDLEPPSTHPITPPWVARVSQRPYKTGLTPSSSFCALSWTQPLLSTTSPPTRSRVFPYIISPGQFSAKSPIFSNFFWMCPSFLFPQCFSTNRTFNSLIWSICPLTTSCLLIIAPMLTFSNSSPMFPSIVFCQQNLALSKSSVHISVPTSQQPAEYGWTKTHPPVSLQVHDGYCPPWSTHPPPTWGTTALTSDLQLLLLCCFPCH